MTTEPLPPNMTPEDRARAEQYRRNQLAIQRKREAAARALLAPPGPALQVKRAWAPVTKAGAPSAASTPLPAGVLTGHGTPDTNTALPGLPATHYLDLNTGVLYEAEATP